MCPRTNQGITNLLNVLLLTTATVCYDKRAYSMCFYILLQEMHSHVTKFITNMKLICHKNFVRRNFVSCNTYRPTICVFG